MPSVPGRGANSVRVRAGGPALLLLLIALLAACGQTVPPVGGSTGPTGSGTGTTTASGPRTSTSGPLTLVVDHSAGTQAITVTLTLANQTSQAIQYEGGCATPYAVEMRNAGGTLVAQWPATGTVHCGAIAIVTLDPGKTHAFAVVQTSSLKTTSGAPVPAGTYTLSASFRMMSYQGGPASAATNVQLQW